MLVMMICLRFYVSILSLFANNNNYFNAYDFN